MVSLKNLAAKPLAISVIRRVVSILAGLLLIISIASPFCLAGIYGINGTMLGDAIERNSFWSYRSDSYHFANWIPGARPFDEKFWFSDYWFSFLNQDYPKLTWVIMLMFILQVLTLVFGIISIISNRRILSVVPVYLSITVLALMIYTTKRLSGMYPFGFMNYEQGYYFNYYTVGLFLSAFVLNEITNASNKNKITDHFNVDSK